MKLADAQFVITHECGFLSWSRLKAHIESLVTSRRLVNERGDRDMNTLHIRCGSDIQDTLPAAGLVGDYLEFSDPFCIGPVAGLPPEVLLRLRARFLTHAFGMHERDALKSYGRLERLGRYEQIVLWFEHDSYDQLIPAYLLHQLYTDPPKARVELVAAEAIPGVSRFIGVGQLAPDLLAWLWRQRRLLEAPLLELATRAQKALTADSPEALQALVATSTPVLPMMGRALARHLQELPAVSAGLGFTEQLTLEIVRDHGPLTVGKAFSLLMREYEPLPYLGDLMFWWQIQPLINSADAALEIADTHEPRAQRQLMLTGMGRAVLEGRYNWLAHAPAERWVGGIRLAARIW